MVNIDRILADYPFTKAAVHFDKQHFFCRFVKPLNRFYGLTSHPKLPFIQRDLSVAVGFQAARYVN